MPGLSPSQGFPNPIFGRDEKIGSSFFPAVQGAVSRDWGQFCSLMGHTCHSLPRSTWPCPWRGRQSLGLALIPGDTDGIPGGTPGPLCSQSRSPWGAGARAGLLGVRDTPGASSVPGALVPSRPDGDSPATCPLRVPRALPGARLRSSPGSPGRLPGSAGTGRSRNDGGNKEWVGEQSAADAELWWGLGRWRHRLGTRDAGRLRGLEQGKGQRGWHRRGPLGHIRAAIPGAWAGLGGLHSEPNLCHAPLGAGEAELCVLGSPKTRWVLLTCPSPCFTSE